MRAIGKNIVIEELKEQIKTESGLLLSSEDSNNLRYGKAKVVSTGGDVVGISDGDTIYYDKRNSFGMVIEGEHLTIIGERSVVVVV